MLTRICVLLGSLFLANGAEIYVDRAYPYQAGPLEVAVSATNATSGSPLDSVLYHPTRPGTYPIFFFIPGLNGFLKNSFYSDFVIDVAQHGYIAITTDLVGVDSKETEKFHFGELYMKQIKWLQQNLNGHLRTAVPGVEGSWDHLALASHSAGADGVLYIASLYPTLAKALTLLGPFSSGFKTAVNFSLPLLLVPTELGSAHNPLMPACITPGHGYQEIWDLWPHPPRVSMLVKGFGHCGVCNQAVWEVCYKTKLCITAQNATSMPDYHTFTQGVTTAFLSAYVGGYNANLKYVTDQKLITEPLLELKVEL